MGLVAGGQKLLLLAEGQDTQRAQQHPQILISFPVNSSPPICLTFTADPIPGRRASCSLAVSLADAPPVGNGRY